MSKQGQKGDKRGLVEYLSVKAELPSDALAGEARIEIRGKNLLFVNGCRRILKYSPELIILSVKNDSVHIMGERLICTSYHAGAVSIEGCIFGVSFGEERS